MLHNGSRRLKACIIGSITVVALLGGVAGYVAVQSAPVIPVLMYHSVDYKDKESKLSVSPEGFRAQMAFLARHHYTVLTPAMLDQYLASGKAVPSKTVMITFDDGNENNYTYAYPILKEHKIPATIFVVVGWTGRPGQLSVEQMREMAGSGFITFGSHTMTHAYLPTTPSVDAWQEISRSKEALSVFTGTTVDTFCYPVGGFTPEVEKMVAQAGYRAAFTTNPRHFKPFRDRYALKRIKITRTADNLLLFWGMISKPYFWFKGLRS